MGGYQLFCHVNVSYDFHYVSSFFFFCFALLKFKGGPGRKNLRRMSLSFMGRNCEGYKRELDQTSNQTRTELLL